MVAPVIAGGLFGLAGGLIQAHEQKKFRRRQRRAIGAAREFADQAVERITSSELFTSAQDFITSTFRDAGTSPLAQDFAKGIRAQQSVRGTFTGNLAAAQEAFGTSGFAQNLRRSLLEPSLQFATTPEQIRQSVLASEVPLQVAAATGAPVAGLGGAPQMDSTLGLGLSQSLSGAAAGFQLQNQFNQSSAFNTQLDQLRQLQGQREGFTPPERRGGQGIIDPGILELIRNLSGGGSSGSVSGANARLG